MSNEKFKVKFGLAVGDTAATIDGTTGDIVTAGDVIINGGDLTVAGTGYIYSSTDLALILTGQNINTPGDITVSGGDIKSNGGTTAISVSGANATVAGDLAVNGGDITTNQTTANIVNTTATTVNLAGAATTVSIGANSGTTTINNSLIADDISIAIVNTTDLEVTNIKAKDGTAAATIANTTGIITVSSQLNVDNLNLSGNTVTSTDTNGNINLTPNGTGNVVVGTDLVINGNEIKSNGGTTAITLNSDDVSVAGFLTVSGNLINSSTGSAITLSGTNVAVIGDLAVNGGDITTPDTVASIFNTTATTVNIAGAATTVSIGANTGTTTINNSLVADDISVATVDTTNLEVTNIKAKDGTAAMSIADTTGIVTVSTELNVDNINISGNTIISTDTNGNITLTPNGTGDVITSKNIVRGAIRNATADANGFIWYLNTSSLTAPYSGISVDNSPSTASQSALVVRNYTGNTTPASIGSRGRLIFEKARNTVASPAAVASGDLLGEVAVTGYTSTGWINDQYTAVPGFFGFTAAENWVANTNLGASFNLTLAPTATTVTSNANLVTCLSMNPQTSAFRTDNFVMSRGKTSAFTATGCSISGTTLTIGTVTSGAVAVGQTLVLTSAGNPINTVSYIVSGSGSTWTLSAASGTLTGASITGFNGFIGIPSAANSVDVLQDLRLITNNIENSTGVTQVQLSASNTLRLVGDSVTIETVSGTDMLVLAPVNTVVSSDTVSLKDSLGVALVGNKIDYNRVYGQWQYDTTVTPAGSNTAYAFPIASGVIDYANIASTASTSRIIPGAAGMYKLQFSVQVQNDDSASEHFAYFWWRKNGTDVPGSMGQVGIFKATGAINGLTIAGWDNMISSANTTDYWELMYAVDDATHVDFPAFAATAFGPSTASLFITLVPIGA